MYVNRGSVTYFDSFRFEYIPKEFKNFLSKKNIRTNIYRTQANDLIKFGYFCTGFVNFMLKGKILLGYINLLSPKENERNEKIKLE